MRFTTLALLSITTTTQLSLSYSFGFHPYSFPLLHTTTTTTHRHIRTTTITVLSSKSSSNDDDDNDDDEQTGMKNAFQSLEGLSSLNDIESTFLSSPSSETKKKPNMTPEEIKAVLQQASSTNSFSRDLNPNEEMEELKLYSGMYKEMEENEDEDGASIYGDILGELKGEKDDDGLSMNVENKASTSGKGFGKTKVMNDADGIGSITRGDNDDDDMEVLRAVELSQDTDEFMRQALEEAMQEVGKNDKGGDKLAAEILKDEEMMREINAIFDRANEELLKGVAEIKAEQQALTDASAKKRSKSLEEDDRRLKEAEESVEKLVAKVRKETLEVEEAVKNLEAVQAELSKDPVMRAVSIKSGGIVSQGALVGALLFSFRSVAELLMLSGPDGSSHIVPAAIQALIAAACAAYLTFATK